MTIIAILTALVIYVTMVYGPIAARWSSSSRLASAIPAVAAISYRQRLVRGPASRDLLRHGGSDRGHLFRALVSYRRGANDGRDRVLLCSGNLQTRYFQTVEFEVREDRSETLRSSRVRLEVPIRPASTMSASQLLRGPSMSRFNRVLLLTVGCGVVAVGIAYLIVAFAR